MRTKDRSYVVWYCEEEVRRQGHDPSHPDGWSRVANMLNAWCFATGRREIEGREAPTLNDLAVLGRLIEPAANPEGFRSAPVFLVSPGGLVVKGFPPPAEVGPRLARLFGMLEPGLVGRPSPLEFYRELLETHPFIDGNGRAGKVVLNWLNGTLRRPIFPPADFWGRRIENP